MLFNPKNVKTENIIIGHPSYPQKLGISYMGSKRGIALGIVDFLHRRYPKAKYFYDLFGGGGSVTFTALQFGYKVFYNEFNEGVYNLMNFITHNKMPENWWDWVSREKFFDHKDLKDPYSQMISVIWSFGNSFNTYMFGTDKEDLKMLGRRVVVNSDEDALEKLNSLLGVKIKMPCGDSINDRRINFRRILETTEGLAEFEKVNLQQLQQLCRLERIELLTHTKPFNMTNLSYDQVKIETPIDETIVYCDPPYRGTAEYVGEFDTDKLDKWFAELPCPAYMSEYTAPFKRVFKLYKRSLLQGGSGKLKEEGLFWNGK